MYPAVYLISGLSCFHLPKPFRISHDESYSQREEERTKKQDLYCKTIGVGQIPRQPPEPIWISFGSRDPGEG